MLDQVQSAAQAVNQRTMQTLDSYYPPSKRSDHYNVVRTWINENPRLAIFVALHLIFSGGPALFFGAFAVSVFIGAVVTALTLAIAFTAFVVGLASLVLLPVLFITTILATGCFISGYVVYAVTSKFATDPRTEPLRRKTHEYTSAAIHKSQDVANQAASQTQAAALSAADTANQVSNGRLEKALGHSKQVLEQERTKNTGTAQVPAPASVSASGHGSPANANGSTPKSDNGAHATVDPRSEDQKVAEARAGSRPALF